MVRETLEWFTPRRKATEARLSLKLFGPQFLHNEKEGRRQCLFYLALREDAAKWIDNAARYDGGSVRILSALLA